MVNARRVSIPSYEVRLNDVITIREGSKKTQYFSALAPQWMKAFEAPSWLKVDTTLFIITVQGVPTLVESGIEGADLQSLIEFYSR